MNNNNLNSIYKTLFTVLLVAIVAGGYYINSNYNITPKSQEVTPPIQEVTPPIQEVTPPIQEVTPPIQEVTPPVQEVTPPVIKIEKPKEFLFSPNLPENSKRKAVIELGSEGFNYFIVDIDKKKNWSKVKYKWGLSLLYEGGVEPKHILKKVKDSISEIQAKHKVKDIHFIISSGAQNLPIAKEIVQVVESRYTVEKVTQEKEGKLAFYASVPKKFRDNSFVVDIGSNNTKIAWLNDKNKLITRTTFGAKYYKHDITNKEAFNSVKNVALDIPNKRKKHCFIIGGAPYKLAKKTRKSKEERFTVLFYPNDYLNNSDKYGLKLVDTDDNNQSKINKVGAGLNIYRAIFDATKTEQFIFDWNANFTIGYLLLRRF